MIDAELVTRKMALIVRDLDALASIADKDVSAYLASSTDEPVTERYLERLIGRMIDINSHLLTESGQAPPPDYHASFVQLVALGVLDREFATRIALSAGVTEPNSPRVRRPRPSERIRRAAGSGRGRAEVSGASQRFPGPAVVWPGCGSLLQRWQ